MQNYTVRTKIFVVIVIMLFIPAYIIINIVPQFIYAQLQTVPSRSIVKTENILPLWQKEIKLVNGNAGDGVDFFTPTERSVVFWNANFLNSLDILTGKTLWQTEAPDQHQLRLSDNKFFLLSYRVINTFPNAPELNTTPKDKNCSYYDYGISTLISYNASNGEVIWGYRYKNASPYYISFEKNTLYLTGSRDHGNSRSRLTVNKNTGAIIYAECNGPNETRVGDVPYNKSENINTYGTNPNEINYLQPKREYRFLAEGNRLKILNTNTRAMLAFVDFTGNNLNIDRISIVNKNNLIVIYMQDSHQLLSFALQK